MNDPISIALRPVMKVLQDPETEDVAFNGPGEAWVYRRGSWSHLDAPEMSYRRLHGIAVLAASQSRGKVGPLNPLLSTDIPSGHRLQVLLPPSVPTGTTAHVYRRHSDTVSPPEEVETRFDTSLWNQWAKRHERELAENQKLLAEYDSGSFEGFLREAALARLAILFGGATGAGKTTLLKTFLSIVPIDDRVLVIEDAREAVIHQPNHVRMIFSDSLNQVTLLRAAMRMRPDKVVLGELRDPEAGWTLINEAMTGHKGSPTSIHGHDAPSMAKRLFHLVKGSKEGKMMQDSTVIGMLSDVVDVLIPIANINGKRSIKEVWFRADAARRGETLADLIEGG